MIDWISAEFKCRHKRFGETFLVVDEDGVIKKSVPAKHIVGDATDPTRVLVRSLGDDRIFISGNPLKVLQRHNCFGSNDFRAVCIAFISHVISRLGIMPTVAEIQGLEDGRFWVKRVDVAEHFWLPDGVSASSVIRELCQMLLDRGKTVHGYPGWSGVSTGRKSKFHVFKAYDKARELVRSPIKSNDPLVGRIVRRAMCSIRVEFRFQFHRRRKPRLGVAAAWSKRTAYKLFRRGLRRLRIGQLTVMPADVQLKNLPFRLRQVVQIWRSGCRLDDFYNARTLQRHRRDLLHLGIEIQRRPSSLAPNAIAIARILEFANKLSWKPKWARGTPFLFEPATAPTGNTVVKAGAKDAPSSGGVVEQGKGRLRGLIDVRNRANIGAQKYFITGIAEHGFWSRFDPS